METKKKSSIYVLAMTAVMAAVIAAVSPFAIPIGPISLSLCTLVLYMTPYILGWQRSAIAALVFILLGMVGVPVFTGFQGGMGKVLGPTAGDYYRTGHSILSKESDASIPGDGRRYRCTLHHGYHLVYVPVRKSAGCSPEVVRNPLYSRRFD